MSKLSGYFAFLANCLLIEEYLSEIVKACMAMTEPFIAIMYLPPERDPS
jgi:hypothetical protein